MFCVRVSFWRELHITQHAFTMQDKVFLYALEMLHSDAPDSERQLRLLLQKKISPDDLNPTFLASIPGATSVIAAATTQMAPPPNVPIPAPTPSGSTSPTMPNATLPKKDLFKSGDRKGAFSAPHVSC